MRECTNVMMLLLTAAVATLLGSGEGQSVDQGRITGAITDQSGGVIPGVTVRVTGSGVSRQAVTDTDGLFEIRDLPFGGYEVVTALAGFRSASARVTLSAGVPRAHLAWRLAIGCLSIVDRIRFDPRGAAPLVDVIVHLRVTADSGGVLRVPSPTCAGERLYSYAVEAVRSIPGGGSRRARIVREVLIYAHKRRLTTGSEYLAMIWPDDKTEDHLIFPVVDGRIATAERTLLSGMSIDEAFAALAEWARQRR
jgi:hypothetical protein